MLICFLLGNFPASELYMSTFRNTLSVLSSYLLAYEDGRECSETSAYKIQTPRNYPEEIILLTVVFAEYYFFDYYLCASVRWSDPWQSVTLKVSQFFAHVLKCECCDVRDRNLALCVNILSCEAEGILRLAVLQCLKKGRLAKFKRNRVCVEL